MNFNRDMDPAQAAQYLRYADWRAQADEPMAILLARIYAAAYYGEGDIMRLAERLVAARKAGGFDGQIGDATGQAAAADREYREELAALAKEI